MEKKQFKKLKKQVDFIFEKAEQEALESGESIASPEAQEAFEKLKSMIVEKSGLSLEEFEKMEEEYEEQDEKQEISGEKSKAKESRQNLEKMVKNLSDKVDVLENKDTGFEEEELRQVALLVQINQLKIEAESIIRESQDELIEWENLLTQNEMLQKRNRNLVAGFKIRKRANLIKRFINDYEKRKKTGEELMARLNKMSSKCEIDKV